MTNTIYSYYVDVPILNRVDELKLVVLWAERWREQGWNPVVLNEHIARKHPFFNEYEEATSKLPSVNPAGYDRACWIRHLALAQVGGGFMSDFDVIPYAPWESTRLLDTDGVLQMFQRCAPSFFFATKEALEKIVLEFATGKWGKQEINGKDHYSDMYSLVAMAEFPQLPSLVQPHDIVLGFGDKGWEQAPYVHYSSSSMAPAKKLPKWKWIPKLRE